MNRAIATAFLVLVTANVTTIMTYSMLSAELNQSVQREDRSDKTDTGTGGTGTGSGGTTK